MRPAGLLEEPLDELEEDELLEELLELLEDELLEPPPLEPGALPGRTLTPPARAPPGTEPELGCATPPLADEGAAVLARGARMELTVPAPVPPQPARNDAMTKNEARFMGWSSAHPARLDRQRGSVAGRPASGGPRAMKVICEPGRPVRRIAPPAAGRLIRHGLA
jgi:hypothetical protein